ncbi:hypothetical protein BJX63DRAFT_440381 [Aspergillus granulosus]|uniref:ER-bound oxygenase mpaB/mpaB'/Rubber oxygenase catalytic domain-containing protein n=1 Tax=Aspergillus granulosus TaxID=176169 RepID=A0ABR4GVN3_9EURO
MTPPADQASDSSSFTMYEPVVEPELLRKMMKDGIYGIGGQYAILMQFAHPGLARGSAEHSDFASRILNRLKTTTRYLIVAVYGTREEKEAIFSIVHRSHSMVKGDGYFADDPELHKWTAATLFMSLVAVHEAFIGKMSEYTKRTLYKETAIFATSLRMPPEMWPKTYEDFCEYWNHNVETLQITHWARDLARALMYPKGIPLVLKPALPFARLITASFLPDRIRRDYGCLPDPNNRRTILDMTVGAIALSHMLAPPFVRNIPHYYYKRNMKKAVKRIKATGSWVKTRG